MLMKIFISGSVVLILQHILSIVYIMGYHKRVYKHHPGPCRNVGIEDSGSEHIALLSNGLAFITSGLKLVHHGFSLDSKVLTHRGQIFLFDFTHPEKNVTNLKIIGNKIDVGVFNPHGVSVYEDKKSRSVTLFVINHRLDMATYDESVEVFQFDQQTLTLIHKKTISDPNFMKSPNDLVALSTKSFYFTNDGQATSYLARNVERWLMLARGDVIYYDGKSMQKVVDRGFGCDGIAISPDDKFIYVSQPMHMTVNVYRRKADSSLSLAQVLNLGTSPNNIFVEPDTGNLLIACEPIVHRVSEHFANKEKKSPSQVLHLKWEDNNMQRKYTLSEMFVDPGDLISAGSIATYYQGNLLIGSTIDRLAYCEVNAY